MGIKINCFKKSIKSSTKHRFKTIMLVVVTAFCQHLFDNLSIYTF